MSSVSYQYGPGADLTGPCLITVSYASTASTSVTQMVQMCTAGNIIFDNPISHISEKCSYLMTDTTQKTKQTCRIAPLSGDLVGSGDIRTLIDESTAITLTATTVYIGTDYAAYLPVINTAAMAHFISAGAAEASGGSGTVATTTAGSAKTSKTSTAGVSTKTSSAGGASATTGTSLRTSTGTSAAGVTAGSSTTSGAAAAGTTAAATTSARSGQSKVHVSKVGTLAVVGSLVWALYAF